MKFPVATNYRMDLPLKTLQLRNRGLPRAMSFSCPERTFTTNSHKALLLAEAAKKISAGKS